MAKLKVQEIRPVRRDPRVDEDEAPSTARSARPPGTPDELMRVLRGLPPVPDGSEPPPSANGLRDLFGIVGTTLAEVFQVESVVAHGGFSVIYKAKHLRFGAPTALKCLKMLPTQTKAEREDFLSKFKAEGEVMFRLSSSCPEVVRPLHIDSFRLSDGQVVPFIALEWLEGQTLRDRIIRRLQDTKEPLSPRRALAMLSPVARVLARAHDFPSPGGRLAILHCDLKPDNIFIAEQDGGEVLKIFDFGIAKVRSAATREAGAATVHSGPNMFTPAYAAPEQWSPDKFGQTGPWTDVFALALTLTEVITQRPAIDGPGTAMLMRCLDESKRPTPRTLGLDIPDRLESVFAHALAVDPRARTRSVEELWNDLEDALQMPRTFGSGRNSLTGIPSTFDWDESDAPARGEALQSFSLDEDSPNDAAEPRPDAPPPAAPIPADEPRLPSNRPAPIEPTLPRTAGSDTLAMGAWIVALVACLAVIAIDHLASLSLPLALICGGILLCAAALTAQRILTQRKHSR